MEYPVDNTPLFNYIVLDEQGYFFNSILATAPYPAGVYAGNKYVAYAGNDPAPQPPDDLNITSNCTYLLVRPSIPMQRGSHMNIQTGEVTPPPPAPPEEIVEGLS